MDDKTHDHADVKIHPPILTGLHLLVVYLLVKFSGFPLTAPPTLEWFGFALVVIGFIFGAAAFLAFRKARTTVMPHGSVSAIVSSGIFGLTRNPIYLGFLLMIIGIPLNSGTWWGLVVAPIFIHSANRLVIEREEAYLEKKFGAEYTRYKSRVRRWL